MTKQTKTRAPKIEYKGFLRCNLSKDQLGQFDVWFEQEPDVWSEVAGIVDEGYKFSVGEDSYNNAYTASLYCNTKKLGWAGWTLQAFAGTVDEAVALLFFKHHFVLDHNWEAITERPENSHASRG